MLEIEQLAFCHPSNNQHDVTLPMYFNLTAQQGEILSLIGPSGAGKSSLLNLIAGFEMPTSGRIKIAGHEIQHLDPALRPLSLIFQSHNLFPHLDVFTNIALGLNPSLKLSAEQREKIDEALEKVELQGMQTRKPGQLSGGQRQRVTLARVLVRRHPILLLDEPFAALDPALRRDLITLLKELIISQHMAALLVSHQPTDVVLASARTAFIHKGRVLTTEATEQLLNHCDKPEIRQYLGQL